MSDTFSNPNARGDELSSLRLDGDAPASEETASDSQSHAEVDPAAARRAADVQLVHALLLHLNEDAGAKESRISRVMESLRAADAQAVAAEEAHRARWRFPFRRTGVRWAAAASLAMVITAWVVFLSSGTATAEAQLERMLAATNEQVDRTYEITVAFDDDFIREHFGDHYARHPERSGPGPEGRPPRPKGPPPDGRRPPPDDGKGPPPPGHRPPPDDRKGPPPRGPDDAMRDRPQFREGPGWMHPSDHRPPRHHGDRPPQFRGPPPLPLNGATLFVRGGDQFVLRRPLPDGNTFIIGSNGKETWFVPPRGPVKVSDNPRDFRGPLPDINVTIPFINIKADIEPLRASYDLTVLAPAGLSEDDSVKWYRLEGRRRAGAPPGPARVRIWSHPQTGVVRRLECENMPLPRHPNDRRSPMGPTVTVTVNLVDESPLDEGWFDHAAHHDEDRDVWEVSR